MSDGENNDRRAWSVIVKLYAELRRQSIAGGIRNAVPIPDQLGRVPVVGSLDLASLADAVERALIEAFADAS